MYLSEMSCCALLELANIGNASQRAIKQQIEAIKRTNKTQNYDLSESAGAVFASTSNFQKKTANKLKRLRFTKAFIVRNPNTDNMVTVWYKLLTRPRRKKKK